MKSVLCKGLFCFIWICQLVLCSFPGNLGFIIKQSSFSHFSYETIWISGTSFFIWNVLHMKTLYIFWIFFHMKHSPLLIFKWNLVMLFVTKKFWSIWRGVRKTTINLILGIPSGVSFSLYSIRKFLLRLLLEFQYQ